MNRERKRIAMLFLAVLGRPVESEATLSSMTVLSVDDLLRTLLFSDEFRNEVFARLSQNLQTPHDSLDVEWVESLKPWTQDEGSDLFKDYRQELDNVYAVLDALLSSRGVKQDFERHYADQQTFLARLSERKRGHRRMIGAVEEINGRLCRGYILDASDPDRDLFIRLKVNGLTAAVIPALDYRRDLQDGYGGTGRCGFSIVFSDLIGSDEIAEAVVDIEEASTGFVLLRSERIVFSRHKLLELRADVMASLRAYRSEVDALIRQLSVGEGHTAVTVGDYDAAVPFRPVQPPPDLAEPVSVLVEIPSEGEPEALAETASALLGQGAALGCVILFSRSADGLGTALARLERSGIRVAAVSSSDGLDRLREAIRDCGTSRLALLTAGERLDGGALAWLAFGVQDPSARLAYADSEAVSPEARIEPVFRAAFDPDLLLTSGEYDTPFCLSVQDFTDLDLADAMDDTNLRFSAAMQIYERFGRGAFRHVPAALSRSGPGASTQKRRLGRERIAADHLRRVAPGAVLKPHEDQIAPAVPDRSTVVWPAPRGRAIISLVVPTRDAMDMVLSLIASLKSQTAYLSHLRIYVVSNNSTAPQTAVLLEELRRDPLVAIVEDSEPFNWSRLNDQIIQDRVQDGLVLCVNNDVICQTSNWDEILRAQLARPEVGVVGARLLYPNGTLQHAGIAMNGGWSHEGVGEPPGAGLYRSRTRVVHEAYAVTGAFLAFKRELYDELGGFDTDDLPEAFNDVDFCLKCRRAGHRVIYDPAQVWVHFESVSRGFDQYEPKKIRRNSQAIDLIRRRYGDFADVDLTYNPHFARGGRLYAQLHWPDRNEIVAWIERQNRGSDASAGKAGF